MSKLMFSVAIVALGLVSPAAAQAALGPDAASCRTNAGEPAVLVNIDGFKTRAGKVRVQLYAADSSFLGKGKWLRRVDLPVTGTGPMQVCLAAPKPGRYAVAVRHDTKGNGSDWNDGGGFSRNPKISLLDLKPKANEVAISVGAGVKPIDVVLNYRQGLSIGPVRG